ncbi:hypothetical protein RB625_31145 [Streptomyces californicus]|uniref:hypothetical protein n=1 Tax=Streptomyces californicus TaxID=67351 RepID=UPI00296FF607|nr:hypothetical protein [Streptomyces californicus]MDW4902880.1 hypothetical protein [Streptomyces californicus]
MVNLTDVAPLFVVAGAVVTSVAAYKGVRLTAMTSVHTSAATRQHEALGEFLGAVGAIQRSSGQEMYVAWRDFRSAYELVQRSAPESSGILEMAHEINDLVSAVAGSQSAGAEAIHVRVLRQLGESAARDDEELERTGSLGWQHSREVLDAVVSLHAQQDAALAEGRPAPDSSAARAALLEDQWDEQVIDEFLAFGASKRADFDERNSTRRRRVRDAYSGLAAAKSRMIDAERSWMNNPTSPAASRRTVPRLLARRRRDR